MTVRRKAISGIVLIFLITSCLLYAASTFLVQRELTDIEITDTQKNTSRMVDALNNRVDQMSTKLSDWSSWDDTYRFINDRNNAFVISNLQNDSLLHLNLNFMLYFNSKYDLVVAKGVDDSGGSIKIPGQLIDSFASKSLPISNISDIKKGFLTINGRPVIFAARPILNSNGQGPVKGMLVFARYFTPGDMKSIAELTHLSLDFFMYPGRVPNEDRAILMKVNTQSPTVKVQDAHLIQGYQLINDIYGKPMLLARVNLTREAFLDAQKSVYIFLVVIALITLVSIITAIYITNEVIARDKVIQVKDEFFSVASHELRTPLTAIKGNAMMLRDFYGNKNDANFSELTDDITQASMRLIRLVNNFLDAARFENGEIPLTPNAFSLQEVTNIVVNELQTFARDKGIFIKADIDSQLPLVYADKDRVMQIIYNFVGNAAKFTDTGGISVSAVVQADDRVKVLIADTGRGISEEGKKILFTKFRQVSSSDSKSGSGLGLYISKKLVEGMGGTCVVEASEKGKGTTISFTLLKATNIQIAAAKQ